jgi:hypothetical protein
MKTQVTIRIETSDLTDEQYDNLMNEIESDIRFKEGVDSVDVGLGEEIS